MPPLPQPVAPPAPPEIGVNYSTFSGLKNTVSPDNFTERELSRARNVDLDDLGGLSRRRGRTLKAAGSWHSLFTTEGVTSRLTFGVKDGMLVLVNPDFTTVDLKPVGTMPLAWVQVGPVAYFTSTMAAGKISLAAPRTTTPWAGPEGGPDFWHSPVVSPEATLGQVGGRLFGPPPLGSFVTHHNGRIYIAEGPVLWATELFVYNYVDKTKGFRQFESDITGLCGVEDGVYVGTEDALWFLGGQFNEHTRTMRERAGVVPGTMLSAPGNLIDPEGRRFPDLPRQTSKAMICMSHAGAVVGMPGGNTFNLTHNQFIFPRAVKGAAMLRQEDGMNTFVAPLDSGGTPSDNARFGDYLSAEIIKARIPGQPG